MIDQELAELFLKRSLSKVKQEKTLQREIFISRKETNKMDNRN